MTTARPQVKVIPGGTVSARRLAVEDALFAEETELKANTTAQWKQAKATEHQRNVEKKQQKVVAKKAKAQQKLLKNKKAQQKAGGKPKRKRQQKGSGKTPANSMGTSSKPTLAQGRPRKRPRHESLEVERSKAPEKATAQVTRPSRQRRVPEKLR
jgi:hypothetical protein